MGPWIPGISAFTRVFDALCAGMNGVWLCCVSLITEALPNSAERCRFVPVRSRARFVRAVRRRDLQAHAR